MKDLIIIGAGGYGRDLYYIIRESKGINVDFRIAGYIDDNLNALNGYIGYPKLIGKISTHELSDNQIFICSIADMKTKLSIINNLQLKGAVFVNIIHNASRVADSAILGTGNIIGPLVSIGADSIIGNHCILQTGVIIGHDVTIGDFSRIDNYSILVAGVTLKKQCTIHSNTVVNSKVIIEENSIVGACSFVIKNVEKDITVFGNPAKRLL
jgi:sugar O-acyltransferase (sialic acid O-acetyltransferase NeuD family)